MKTFVNLIASVKDILLCDTYCARKYRLECLFNQSQLTSTQRQYKQLFTDQGRNGPK